MYTDLKVHQKKSINTINIPNALEKHLRWDVLAIAIWFRLALPHRANSNAKSKDHVQQWLNVNVWQSQRTNEKKEYV